MANNLDYLDEFLMSTEENFYITTVNKAFIMSDNIDLAQKLAEIQASIDGKAVLLPVTEQTSPLLDLATRAEDSAFSLFIKDLNTEPFIIPNYNVFVLANSLEDFILTSTLIAEHHEKLFGYRDYTNETDDPQDDNLTLFIRSITSDNQTMLSDMKINTLKLHQEMPQIVEDSLHGRYLDNEFEI